MGWNAAASIIQRDFWRKGEHAYSRIVSSHPAFSEFRDASRRLNEEFGQADGTLDIGILCLRGTAKALFDALGEPMVASGQRDPDEVKQMALKANWSLLSEDYAPANKASAKAFLDICAKHDLAIDFG
jgi:hypothetical protein